MLKLYDNDKRYKNKITWPPPEVKLSSNTPPKESNNVVKEKHLEEKNNPIYFGINHLFNFHITLFR